MEEIYNAKARRYTPLMKKDDIVRIKQATINELAANMSRKDANNNITRDERIRMIVGVISKFDNIDMQKADKITMAEEIVDEMFGLGPIQCLVDDTNLSEIMVNGPKAVYVEKAGKIMKTDVTFDNNDHVKRIMDRIVSKYGRHIDDSNPMVDARLEDGSRVNAIIPPVVLCGPCLTIRKFATVPFTIQDLLSFGSLSETMSLFLREAVGAGRLNIVVAGGTGSGKTSLLNAVSSFIPENERIVTIEDAAELKLKQPHVIPHEARPANVEGNGEITIRTLVKNALRERPDRIIVGEVRGGEALDMLQAMNTGHDGSLTTIHANSPKDALARVETTALMSGMQMPVMAIRQQCAAAFDLIVFIERMRDGSRKVTSITEVLDMEDGEIQINELFRFVHDGEDRDPDTNKLIKLLGHYEATGNKPVCLKKMLDNGAKINMNWFQPPKKPAAKTRTASTAASKVAAKE